jgi:mRNA interferase RelE/StbE
LAWKIQFEPRALKEFEKLDRSTQQRVLGFLSKQIAPSPDPRAKGKALTGEFKGLWRYRIGEYRLICDIRDKILVIMVLRIAHRKDIYR